MPPSLKMVVGLMAFAVAMAAASLVVQAGQSRQHDRAAAAALTGGDPRAGISAMARYGCGACHVIPGLPRADGRVGPSLARIATQAFLAGRLANRPESMIAWIVAPQSISPGSGMPDMGVSKKDGRDIAAYLYTLR